MATWMKQVFSSNVAEVGYDTDTEELLVRWLKSGKTSAYKGASEGLAEELSKAPSVGSMVRSDVIPFYPHRYV